MSLKQKRLERGWTQLQLAEYSGLSLRTIQRLEKGKPATQETLKCLASVFETSIADLGIAEAIDESRMSDDEKAELEHIREIRSFVIQLIAYLSIVPLICLAGYLNGNIRNGLGLAVGWGFWLAYCALKLFDIGTFLGKDWEKRELDKRMGRNLKKTNEENQDKK